MTTKTFFALRTLKEIKWGSSPAVPKGALLKKPQWIIEAEDELDAWKNKKESVAKRLASEVNNFMPGAVEVVEIEMTARVV